VRSADVLETERLVLRPRTPAEAAVYHRLWTERDPRVPPHRRVDADGRPTVEEVAAQIQADRDVPGTGLLALERKVEADVIGYCGLTAHGNGSQAEPELAYELLRSAQGRGYATEAGRAVLEWAAQAGHRRLWAGVWDWNLASRRVLEKLGFRESGRVEPTSVHGRTLLFVREL
jgi:ribosomal-protein-alanine N-acetyltransferase